MKLKFHIVLKVLFYIGITCKALAYEEFCNSETFRPNCDPDEVILIEEASFGRKKLGRCLENEGNELNELNMADRKFLGCYADVISTLEPLCSLKKFCEVRVAELNADVPCYKYLRYSLEVRYSCVRVVQESRHCSMKVGLESQHVLISKTSNAACGRSDQPWTIASLPGQKINFKTISFPYISGKNGLSNDIIFSNQEIGESSLGYMVDKTSKKKMFISLMDKESPVIETGSFRSDSNGVEIVIKNKEFDKREINFLLSVEATGCSDLIPPSDAWLKRTEDEAIIGCYSTRLRWQLKCIGQRWIGVIGNCSQGQHLALKSVDSLDTVETSDNNQAIAIFLIVISGIVICLLITCLGIVFLKRYYALSKSRALKQLSINGHMGNGSVLLPANVNDTYDLKRKNLLTCKNLSVDSNTLQHGNTAQYFELDGSLVGKDASYNDI